MSKAKKPIPKYPRGTKVRVVNFDSKTYGYKLKGRLAIVSEVSLNDCQPPPWDIQYELKFPNPNGNIIAWWCADNLEFVAPRCIEHLDFLDGIRGWPACRKLRLKH